VDDPRNRGHLARRPPGRLPRPPVPTGRRTASAGPYRHDDVVPMIDCRWMPAIRRTAWPEAGGVRVSGACDALLLEVCELYPAM